MKFMFFFVVFCVFMFGCASIVSKSDYNVYINSNPQGADVAISNDDGMQVFKGKTPVFLSLGASDGYFNPSHYSLSFSKDGFEGYEVKLGASVDPWYAVGNIIFGGVIGWLVVDPLTGAMWKLKKNVFVNLSEK